MNILLAPNVYLPMASGVPILVRQLAAGLQARGHQVVVVTSELFPGQAGHERVDGIEVHRMPFVLPSPLYWPQHTHGIHALLRRGPVDLRRFAGLLRDRLIDVISVHSVTNGVAAYALAVRMVRPTPLVVTLCGHEFVQLAEARYRFRRAVLRRALGGAARVTALSASLAAEAGRFLPAVATRTIVIPTSVPVDEYDVQAPAAPAPYVLAVARLNRFKGIDVLLAAWQQLGARTRGVQLVIAGDGPERVRLRAVCLALGLTDQVTFLGQVETPRVRELLAGCELLVLPSWNEGLPTVVVEAMASGKAVIATPVGGVPEIVEDGETGLLVPPGEPAALANALRALLDGPDRRRAMGTAARKRARLHHDAARAVDRYVSVFREAIEGHADEDAASDTAGAGAP